MKTMKKTLFLLALAVCLVLALCVTAGAEDYSPAVFKTTPFEATQNGEISTTLYLAENSNLIDFEFQLAYDTELVTLKNAVQATGLSGNMEITPKDGAIHISYTRTSANLTKETNLAVLTFTVDGNVGPDSYDFLKLDENYHSEAHTMISDDLYVLPMETEFAPLEIFDAGDINLSHSVSIADVTILRQALAEMRTLTDYQRDRADAYYDGTVSIADAVRIQQYLADHAVRLGNRVNVTFTDKDGAVSCVKSVVYGESLATVPKLPEYKGYYGGVWSSDQKHAEGVDFQNLKSAMTVYAVYSKDASPAVTFYKERLTEMYYSEDVLSGNLNLVSKLTYQEGYTADIYWRSSNNATLNATTGSFTKPAYDSGLTLTATIISHLDGVIEAQDYISFDYTVKGDFLCPTKAEIKAYLESLFESGVIDYNMTLPSKVTNENVSSNNLFEVRLDWLVRGSDGVETSAVQLRRGNDAENVTLIAVATFNGVPLEDDGRIYIDDITLQAVTQEEVRNYIITQIAANTGATLTNGTELWHGSNPYGATLIWTSQNTAVANIENNVISIKDVVNGTSLPMKVEVNYESGGKATSFSLSYTASVVTDNALLVPGTNIDPYLYNALKSATGVFGNLTTDALKSVKFVYLDLSAYPEIQDLTALTYCKNLRVLNISGLHVDENSLNQICTLNKLEALIANNCGIKTMTVGGVPVLDKMINLKMLDLSHNELTSLDSVLSKKNRYGQMQELYLNDNQLTDISALCEMTEHTTNIYNSDNEIIDSATEMVATNRAPMLRFLTLDNNHLNDADMAAFGNFKVLKYLSLGNNELTTVSSFKDIRSLLELHLQGNQISDVRDLRFLTRLQSLYLSHNQIRNVFAGAKEVNVSYLRYLTDLEILYLNDNDIEDIEDLETLSNLKVLNVNNNRIQSLSMLADKGETMVELYAENNEIDSFSFIQNLTGLTRLMLSNNGSVYESTLPGYLSNLTKLRTLTLSGKDLRSLAFLDSMPNLVRLDVANCKLPSYLIQGYKQTDNGILVTSYVDNVASILGRKSTLKYLDVSNNGLAYSPESMSQYLQSIGTNLAPEKISFENGTPVPFDALYELTNLKVLYADNLADPVNATHLFSIMTGINYLSMENCGIKDASWLEHFRGLVYVDLAGNSLKEFDLGNYISIRSRGTLEYLYIDSRTETEFPNAFSTFDGNVLKEFSAENVQIPAMDFMPDMENLESLNMSYSKVQNLTGDNPDFDGWFNLSRYQNVKTLDISGVQADIAEVKNLKNLQTLYAIGGPKDAIFQKQNLLDLYAIHNSGVTCYLYDYSNKYNPLTSVEGKKILDTLDDYSCDLVVSGSGISDNNPVLPEKVNGFDITWTVTEGKDYYGCSGNYSVKDHQIVLNPQNNGGWLEDDTLTLTATISVYPGQGTVSRSYEINTTILHADESYLGAFGNGYARYLVRGKVFEYSPILVESKTDGFAAPVYPMAANVQVQVSAVQSDGGSIDPGRVYSSTVDTSADTLSAVRERGHILYDPEIYTIKNDAPLGAELTIRFLIGHYVAVGAPTSANPNVPQLEFVTDCVVEKQVTVAERTFTLTYEPNGGVVTAKEDGRVLTSEGRIEDSPLFDDINVTRDGYTFTGWYQDSALTKPVTTNVMPMSNLTVYAGWNINSYTVSFDANGGSAVAPQSVVYGQTASVPEQPTRENYRFLGWYTDPEFTNEWDSTVPVSGDMTIYAKWIYNEYTVTFDANGGTGSTSAKVLYGSTATAPAVSRTGYSLSGWYTDSACTNAWDINTKTVTEDVTLYAGWTANSYKVTFNANGGSVGTSSKTVTYASTYGTLPTPSRTGYTFDGWYSASSGGTKITNTTKVSTAYNHTLYAHWSIIRVTIPNFSGNSASYATNWCNNNGIKYNLSYAYDYNVGSGNVRSNTYAGSTVNYGTTITIYVSNGAKPIAVGDTVYYVGGNWNSNSYGNGSWGWGGAGNYTVKYMASGRAYPYNLNGSGWVPASSVYQRTN